MRIVFMGTPDFAVSSLKILVENGYNIVGVITATDKYGGRGGKKLIESAVKKYAVSQGLKVMQPKNLKAPDFVDELRSLNVDLQVVVAFRMLPQIVWAMPTIGTFNLHGSLLPKYRGAAPIHWAVINGETETGVTTFFLQHKIDTGDVIFQEKMSIGEEDTTGEVHDKMMELGAATILKTVKVIEDGSYTLQPQNDEIATHAPKIFRETCEINFNQPTKKVHNFIRGMSPFPVAWTTLEEKQLKIIKASKILEDHDFAPGTYVSDNKKSLKIATVDGFIAVYQLQLQGKRRMEVVDFLNGYTFEEDSSMPL
ncbi:MAG: methionyl-tRNA formyltransferase [Paraglaciecola sp.]|jgi:methionyl-tRNA formyltransferase